MIVGRPGGDVTRTAAAGKYLAQHRRRRHGEGNTLPWLRAHSRGLSPLLALIVPSPALGLVDVRYLRGQNVVTDNSRKNRKVNGRVIGLRAARPPKSRGAGSGMLKLHEGKR